MPGQLYRLWETLKAATGIKRGLLGVSVSTFLAGASWLSKKFVQIGILPPGAEDMIFDVPSWTWAALSALAFLFYWSLTYAHKLRTQIEISRVELSKLRKNGVELRNRGRHQVTNNADLAIWHQDTLDWHNEVYEQIKKISEADAEWFYTMDVVPEPRLPLLNPVNKDTHPKRYGEHDFQVKRLGEMIRDLWGQ